jgi:uncharacterized protein YlxP (DUF503 family)
VVVWLNLQNCHSQREKTQRIERIMGKLRMHFNVSLTYLGPDDRSERVALGMAAAAREKREAAELLEQAIDALAVHPEAQILGDPEWR